jgi:dipeptidyl aminopeptidase/acylaminoacyl peptidase
MNWRFSALVGDAAPIDDIETAWSHSPAKYLPNATTPTLIIHSEEDHRCPIEQGEQAFVLLKVKAGVDTEMVRFPGEPHGLSRGGRTDRRIVRLNHILRWMDKYLKEDQVE